jgi:hypothetical protein
LAERPVSPPEAETTSPVVSVDQEHEASAASMPEQQAGQEDEAAQEVASAAQEVASAAQEVASAAQEAQAKVSETQEVASGAQAAAASAAQAAAASAAEEVAVSAAKSAQAAEVAQAAQVAQSVAATAAGEMAAAASRRGRRELREKTDAFLSEQMQIALRSMTSNTQVNNRARFVIYFAAAALLAVMVYYLLRFGVYLDPLYTGDRTYPPEVLVAMSLPIMYCIGGACICVALAILIQSRNVRDFSSSLDQVSRLRREGTTSDTRSRALTQVLEETLVNAKQAFSMQLWISRALFVVGVALFLVFLLVLAFFNENRALTGTSVASSIIAFAGAAFFNPEQRIGANLANVTKLEAILGGYTRQASVLEEHLYRMMEHCEEAGKPESANDIVLAGVDKLSDVLDTTVRSISENVETRQQESPRERWLWEQLVTSQNGSSQNSTGLGDTTTGPDVAPQNGSATRAGEAAR